MRRFTEISNPFSVDSLTPVFSYRFSGKRSSLDSGSTLVRLNCLLELSLKMTFKLLFFLMALNCSVPLVDRILSMQYFLSSLLPLVDRVCSLRCLYSRSGLGASSSMVRCALRRELL